jgi:hypothetical protein
MRLKTIGYSYAAQHFYAAPAKIALDGGERVIFC